MSRLVRWTALGIAALVPGAAMAQGLAQRIARSDATALQFSFAARDGVCGDGRTFLSAGSRTIMGSSDGAREPCVAGPVRVVLARVDRQVVELETFVGPPAVAPGATDLGTVGTAEAVEYLLSLAREAEGRPSRDAVVPMALADSVDVTPRLLALARDQRRPRETRQRALSWAPWSAGEPAPAAVVTGLRDVARDGSDNQAVRRHAVQVLARLDRGAGVGEVLRLSESDDRWLAKEALTALSRSGDPRARAALRGVAERSNAPAEMRATAIRGLGRQFATGTDAEFLRSLYPKLDDDATREAVIAAVSDIGGATNLRWLLEIAADGAQPVGLRRRAATSAGRAGATTAELVRLYDGTTDAELKRALIDLYVRAGDRAAVDKLLVIARTEPDRDIRRRTISRLSRVDDPRVKEALRELIER